RWGRRSPTRQPPATPPRRRWCSRSSGSPPRTAPRTAHPGRGCPDRPSPSLLRDATGIPPDKMAVGMKDMVRSFEVVRVRAEERGSAVDRAATEEPLEIRLHRQPFAVIMRTPGADRELAAGFLLAERVIAGADDLGLVEHCVLAPERGADNTVNVTLIDP